MKENKIIIITMILNLIVAVIKLTAGIVFSFSTLIADSIQSFIDFITDIMSLFANKIGKRRANKNYPFGYGQVYYLANLITGLLLFLIGIFILYQFIFFKGIFKPNLKLFIILSLVLIIKFIVVKLLTHFGKAYKNELMIEASKESGADLISTLVVLIVSILVLFEKYFPYYINIDKIASLIMALYVFYVSIKMIVVNINGILLNTEENEDIKEDVTSELKKFNEFELKTIKIIKMASYYHIFLQVKVKDSLTIRKYLLIEKQIKMHLKSKNKQIRFIDIEPI